MKLTSKDICDIIEAGHKGCVSKIKLGSFVIEYVLKPIEHTEPMVQAPTSDQSGTVETTDIQVAEVERQRSNVPTEAELDEMLITNPAAYEKLILSGELGDGRGQEEA